MLGLFTGSQVLVTGVEDDPSGMLRMYVGPRYKWTYVLIEDERDKETLRRAWAGGSHVVAPKPDADQLYVDEEALERARAEREARWASVYPKEAENE